MSGGSSHWRLSSKRGRLSSWFFLWGSRSSWLIVGLLMSFRRILDVYLFPGFPRHVFFFASNIGTSRNYKDHVAIRRLFLEDVVNIQNPNYPGRNGKVRLTLQQNGDPQTSWGLQGSGNRSQLMTCTLKPYSPLNNLEKLESYLNSFSPAICGTIPEAESWLSLGHPSLYRVVGPPLFPMFHGIGPGSSEPVTKLDPLVASASRPVKDHLIRTPEFSHFEEAGP